MHIGALWDALGLVTLGVAVSLVGRYLRNEYHRLFSDNPRANEKPAYELGEAGLRRGAVIFLTFGAILVVLGIGLALSELLAKAAE
jgi:hypothetical protein